MIQITGDGPAAESGGNDWVWYTRNIILNDCLHSHPASILDDILTHFRVLLNFDLSRYYFCLTGMKKSIYYPVFGLDANSYMKLYHEMEDGLLALLDGLSCRGNVFLVFEDDCKQIAVLFTPPDELSSRAVAESVGKYVQNYYEEHIFRGDGRYCNFTALSSPLSELSGIREGFLAVRSLSDLSFFKMEPITVTAEDILSLRNSLEYRKAFELCHELELTMISGDGEKAADLIETLFLRELKSSFSFPLFRDVLSFLRSRLDLHLSVYGLIKNYDLEKLCGIENYIVLEECENALLPPIEALCRSVREHGVFQSVVQQAVYFIRHHCREDITLPLIAQNAGVSPNYLSGMFSRETGMSLRDYVTLVRMEYARELLLSTDLLVYQIADEVGIRDPKYFSRLFKNFSGENPQDFRKAVRSGADA